VTRAAWLGAILLALTGCTADFSRRGNLERCLADDPYCDASLLSVGEQQRVFEARSQQHLQDCLAGWRCNEATLTVEERQRVQASVAQLNFEACLKGEASCRNDLLDEDERIGVERAAALRNVELCMSGLTACNEVALTDPQRAGLLGPELRRLHERSRHAGELQSRRFVRRAEGPGRSAQPGGELLCLHKRATRLQSGPAHAGAARSHRRHPCRAGALSVYFGHDCVIQPDAASENCTRSWQVRRYQASPNGRNSTLNDQAQRSWCATCQISSAIAAGWMKKSSGLSL